MPRDNGSRLAIFDAICEAGADNNGSAVPEDEIAVRVIPRLRVLVPRELHFTGDEAYVKQKVEACVNDGMLERSPSDRGGLRIARVPRVGYPDGGIRDYEPGLEIAKERLDAVNAKLRSRGFEPSRVIPSIAAKPNSHEFRVLVASMREQGFMRQFPITVTDDGETIDGRAREAAAAVVGVKTVEHLLGKPLQPNAPPERRDTPLHRLLLMLDANSTRLTDDDRSRAHAYVEARSERPWAEIEADLAKTREWRLTPPRTYIAHFDDVRLVPYRDGADSKVQVTGDGKVMLGSLLVAAGFQGWKRDDLLPYVPSERARSPFGGGQPAIFVGIDDAIAGIEAMQAARRKANRRVDRRWDEIRDWLLKHPR